MYIQIEQDMCEIFSKELSNLKTDFIENWNKYVIGILMYSEGNSKLKSRNEFDSSSKYTQILF